VRELAEYLSSLHVKGNRREAVGERWEGSIDPKLTGEEAGLAREKAGGAETHRGQQRPNDLSTVSRDYKNDGDVAQHGPVAVSIVGEAPTSPAVEFREVGGGALGPP